MSMLKVWISLMSTVLVYSSPEIAVVFKTGGVNDDDYKAISPEFDSVIVYPRVKQQLGPREHKNEGNVI